MAQQIVEPSGSPLPLVHHNVYSTRSLDVARDRLIGTFIREPSDTVDQSRYALQMCSSHDSFECTHNAFEMRNALIHAMHLGAPMRFVDVPGVKTELALIFVIRGQCHVQMDETQFDVSGGEMFVINPGQSVTAITSSNFQQLVVRIRTSAIAARMSRMVHRSTSVPLWFDMHPSTVSGPTASLVRFIRLLCDEIDSNGSVMDNRVASESYDQMLLSLVLTSLPHNYDSWLSHGVPSAAPHYIFRAERFIKENLCSPITLDDIVAASGVQSRSLQRSFREFRRLTPMLFLKECRLQHVRKELQNMGRIDRPIAEIAHEAGFEHPSKFSKAYRNRFGELPSETRRRVLPPESH